MGVRHRGHALWFMSTPAGGIGFTRRSGLGRALGLAALAPDAGEVLLDVHSGVGDLNPCLSAIFRSALAWMPHIYFDRRSCAALRPQTYFAGRPHSQ